MCDRFAALEARLSNVGGGAPAETPSAPKADEDDDDVATRVNTFSKSKLRN